MGSTFRSRNLFSPCTMNWRCKLKSADGWAKSLQKRRSPSVICDPDLLILLLESESPVLSQPVSCPRIRQRFYFLFVFPSVRSTGTKRFHPIVSDVSVFPLCVWLSHGKISLYLIRRKERKGTGSHISLSACCVRVWVVYACVCVYSEDGTGRLWFCFLFCFVGFCHPCLQVHHEIHEEEKRKATCCNQGGVCADITYNARRVHTTFSFSPVFSCCLPAAPNWTCVLHSLVSTMHQTGKQTVAVAANRQLCVCVFCFVRIHTNGMVIQVCCLCVCEKKWIFMREKWPFHVVTALSSLLLLLVSSSVWKTVHRAHSLEENAVTVTPSCPVVCPDVILIPFSLMSLSSSHTISLTQNATSSYFFIPLLRSCFRFVHVCKWVCEWVNADRLQRWLMDREPIASPPTPAAAPHPAPPAAELVVEHAIPAARIVIEEEGG